MGLFNARFVSGGSSSAILAISLAPNLIVLPYEIHCSLSEKMKIRFQDNLVETGSGFAYDHTNTNIYLVSGGNIEDCFRINFPRVIQDLVNSFVPISDKKYHSRATRFIHESEEGLKKLIEMAGFPLREI